MLALWHQMFQADEEDPRILAAVFNVERLQGLVRLRCRPDVAHVGLGEKELVIALHQSIDPDDRLLRGVEPREARNQSLAHPFHDALREHAQYGGLVREILIERTDGHTRTRRDLAHAHGIAACFGNQFRSGGENALHAFLRPLLRRLSTDDGASRHFFSDSSCLTEM